MKPGLPSLPWQPRQAKAWNQVGLDGLPERGMQDPMIYSKGAAKLNCKDLISIFALLIIIEDSDYSYLALIWTYRETTILQSIYFPQVLDNVQ